MRKRDREEERVIIKMRKRMLALLLALCTAVSLLTVPAYAESTDAQPPVEAVEQEEAQLVVGFAPFDVSDYSLSASGVNRPTEAQLLARMPETLDVVLESGETVAAPVQWACTEEYADSDDFFFLFTPVFDENAYVLAEDIELLRDAPYVGVFLSPEEVKGIQTQSYCSAKYAPYEEQTFVFLTTEMDMNAAQACGIMANIYNECGFKPDNLQNSYEKSLGYDDDSYTAAVDSGAYRFQEKVDGSTKKYSNARDSFAHDHAGYGFCQWTYYTRKEAMYDYIKNTLKASIGSATAQLKFFKKEVLSDYSNTYKKILSYSNNADGAYDAGYYWVKNFERCNEYYNGVNEWEKRAVLARDKYWPMYKNFKVENVVVEEVNEEAIGLFSELNSVKSAEITLSKTSYTYNGDERKPKVTVKALVYDEASGEDVIEVLEQDDDYTVEYLNNKKVGTATVIVTGKGDYSGCEKKTFTIKPKTTVVAGASSKESKKLTVKWEENSSATGYEIQVATDSKFSKNLKKKTVSKKSTVKYTFSKLKGGKKYYIRIRAYKTVKDGENEVKYKSGWKVYEKTVKVKK